MKQEIQEITDIYENKDIWGQSYKTFYTLGQI